MRAHEVIRPNADADYWDVPKSDMMIRRYRVIGGPMIYEVIEPSSLMGPHGEIMSLWDGKTHEYYGTVNSRRANAVLSDLEGAERTKVYRTWISRLYWQCYGTIVSVLRINMLLDGVKTDMGRIEIWNAN